jgi:hypothetical protein
MKQGETSREDGHLVIGELADGHLADGSGIQHDTLSRWRSGVQIPPGSPASLFYYKNSPLIAQKADMSK